MDKNQLKAGHPVHTYLVEEELIDTLLEELLQTDPKEEFQKFYNLFNHLSTVERRFERKENQLFPFLEQKGGPDLPEICGLSMIRSGIFSGSSEKKY